LRSAIGATPEQVTGPTTIPSRVRIAFVTDALFPYSGGGAERRVHELATRLAAGHDVHIVTWTFWDGESSIQRDGITFHGVGRPHAFYGADGRRTIREGVAFAIRLPRALARLDVDVVDVSATPYLPVYGAWLGTRLSRTPLVATWHEYWGDYWAEYLGHRPLIARAAKLGESFARRLADRRIAVSELTAARLAGGAAHRWSSEIVGNGVDSAAFAGARPAPERTDVIFVGRLIEEKGVARLLGALGLLAGEVPSLRCTIVGDGPERAPLEAQAQALGLADRVRFLGRVPDEQLAPLVRASRILVLPSTREGFGIAVVEAQAAGVVPIVVRSPFSAAPDLVTDGRDGLLCDANETSIAAALRALLGDPARLRRMATAARRAGAERDWDRSVVDVERLYLELIAERRHRPRRHRASRATSRVPQLARGDSRRRARGPGS
jgi:glycosyltransferase involved in cell wall biosynthesis